jgi:thiosulfate/3-mercaptopyruvate sulfurtransferase
VLTLIALLSLALPSAAQSKNADNKGSDLAPGSAALIQPELLLKSIKTGGAKPTILYVGPRFLYAQAHIPGAELIGSPSDSQSLDKLKNRVASLQKSASIILYCGCCPWDHCPNIRPAFKELQKLGFTNIRALYLATSFGTDWVEKGYPVEKGEAAASMK